MEPINWTLVGIVLLFFVLLTIKSFFNIKKFCTICLSVTLTWMTLLILYFIGIFTDKIILAILIGHTSLGIYYILEKKVRKELLIFRLPYLLTSISLIYFILSGFILNGLYVLLGLWLLFILTYLFKFNKFTKKIIECCKKW
jgi:hypothetical protein